MPRHSFDKLACGKADSDTLAAVTTHGKNNLDRKWMIPVIPFPAEI